MSGIKRDLTPLFRPRSLAVIGASNDPAKIRGRILAQIVRGGYPGRIFPIHPAQTMIQGLPAFAAIDKAPGPIDLALIAIPAESVPAMLLECAAAGVRSALVFSSGFAEEEGDGHRALQDRIRAIARDSAMAVAGPNSVGMLDLAEPLAAALPGLRENPSSRRIGIISQSGGLGFALFNRGLKRNLVFSTVINTGNEADLDACDILEFMLDDERTGVVLMFVEAIRRGRRFIELAQYALAQDKPIIVAKIGRSPAGSRAAASHTASLTGSDAVHDAVFRRYGVIRADDQDDMLDIAAACALCPPPAGRRVGIVTISGGVGGWLADTLEAHGLLVPAFGAALQRRIRGFLPDRHHRAGDRQRPSPALDRRARSRGRGRRHCRRLVAGRRHAHGPREGGTRRGRFPAAQADPLLHIPAAVRAVAQRSGRDRRALLHQPARPGPCPVGAPGAGGGA